MLLSQAANWAGEIPSGPLVTRGPVHWGGPEEEGPNSPARGLSHNLPEYWVSSDTKER